MPTAVPSAAAASSPPSARSPRKRSTALTKASADETAPSSASARPARFDGVGSGTRTGGGRAGGGAAVERTVAAGAEVAGVGPASASSSCSDLPGIGPVVVVFAAPPPASAPRSSLELGRFASFDVETLRFSAIGTGPTEPTLTTTLPASGTAALRRPRRSGLAASAAAS